MCGGLIKLDIPLRGREVRNQNIMYLLTHPLFVLASMTVKGRGEIFSFTPPTQAEVELEAGGVSKHNHIIAQMF